MKPTPQQIAYDLAFMSIFNAELYSIEITKALFMLAVERAQGFRDRPDQPRTEIKKIIDALMELAEIPFKQIGAGISKFDDAFAGGFSIKGILEVKSIEFGVEHSNIRCSQPYNFMVVVERESTAALAKYVEVHGKESLIGCHLKFYPKAIYRLTAAGVRELYLKK